MHHLCFFFVALYMNCATQYLVPIISWIIFVASTVMWSAYLWQNQKRRVQSNDETDDDNSHDNDLQSPIDKVDPFSFFIETIQGKSFCGVFLSVYFFLFHNFISDMLPLCSAVQASNPTRFQNLIHNLDFHYQTLANGIAQYAEWRRANIKKNKLRQGSNSVKINIPPLHSVLLIPKWRKNVGS